MPAYRLYVLADSRSPHDYRYVGKRVGELKPRLLRHVAESKKNSRPVSNWIKKVQREGGRVEIIELLECASLEDLNARERFMIHALREAGYRLTNVAAGGDGGFTGYHGFVRPGFAKTYWKNVERISPSIDRSVEAHARRSQAARKALETRRGRGCTNS